MAQAPVRAERIGGVLALVLDAPPGNALTGAVCAALAAALDGIDAATSAVVLLAEGPAFAGDTADDAAVAGLVARIEALPVPLVAALQGRATGAGAALALAAHYRVAAEGATLAFPAVARGLCPGFGATQRLPRLVGAAAVAALARGRALPAATPGLCDRIVPQAALAEAAVALAAAAPPPRPPGDRREALRDLAAFRTALAAARTEARAAPIAAPARILDCIEAAALLPLPQGLAFEATAQEDLAALPESAALSALAAAERRLAAAARAVPPPASILILGAEGEALARAALAAGMRVTLAEATEETLRLALEAVAEGLAGEVAAGRLSAATRAAAWARLTPALAALPGAEDAGLTLLAGPYAEGARPEGLPQAPVALLGRQGPGGLGLLLSPAGRLAEVLAGAATPPEAASLLAAFAARLDRLPVVTRGRGIVAPLAAALAAAARHHGTRQGTAAVDAVLGGFGLKQGTAPRADGPLAARLLGAMANAGLRLLGEGAVARPSDIDAALVHGLGWRRHVPGPMLWAAGQGALVLRADLARWAEEAPEIWTPAPILARLLHDGVPLAALED